MTRRTGAPAASSAAGARARASLLGDEPGSFASARFVRITPMKARRVVDMVRGLPVSTTPWPC